MVAQVEPEQPPTQPFCPFLHFVLGEVILYFEFSYLRFEFSFRTRECAKIFPECSLKNASHNVDNRVLFQRGRLAFSPHH